MPKTVRRRRNALSAVGLFTVGLLLTSTYGCLHEPLARQRANTHFTSMESTLEIVDKTERGQSEQLATAFDLIQRDLNRDAQQLSENTAVINGYFRRDLRRWCERPLYYRRMIVEAAQGNIKQLEPIAIILFY